MFVPSGEHKLTILDVAITCRPGALRVEAKDHAPVEWLEWAGPLVNAGDGTVTPTRAAIHYDELFKP